MNKETLILLLFFSCIGALTTTFTLVASDATKNVANVISTTRYPGCRSRTNFDSTSLTFYAGKKWPASTSYLSDLWTVNATGSFNYPGDPSESSNSPSSCGTGLDPVKPGMFYGSTVWNVDSTGFLMFGGYAHDFVSGVTADLFEYDGSTPWAVKYSTLAKACLTNPATESGWPDAREGAIGWYYDGKYYMYGGKSQAGYQSDIWAWNGATWGNVEDRGVNYTGSGSTYPQARAYANSWSVGARVYIFGGIATDGTALSDWWSFSGTTWTNIYYNVGNLKNADPVYGNQGEFCAGNFPGSRVGSSVYPTFNSDWVFFFGGGILGHNVSNTRNDYWAYYIPLGMWAYMGGTTTLNSAGTYTGSPLIPAARMYHSGWQLASGGGSLEAWLFAGAVSGEDVMHDVWKITTTGSFSICSKKRSLNVSVATIKR